MPTRHRVLFVEDYPPFKRSFAKLLDRAFDFDVIVADSGEDAIGQFGDMHPELIILDLGLPGVSGSETLQVIRALPGGRRVPVIVLTGSDDQGSRETTSRFDIEGYVLKENVMEEFGDLVRGIFPDLRQSTAAGFPSAPGSIVLHDGTMESDLSPPNTARIPASRRTVRVLLPSERADRGSLGWTRRFAKRMKR